MQRTRSVTRVPPLPISSSATTQIHPLIPPSPGPQAWRFLAWMTRTKFGPLFAQRLKRKHPGFGDTFFTDEVFITMTGKRHYLWRAVDQDGDVLPAPSGSCV